MFSHSNRCVVVSAVMLIHISLKDLFMCLFTICLSSLVRYLLKSFAHLKKLDACLLFVVKVGSLHILDTSCDPSIVCKVFPSLCFYFYFLNSIF